MPLYRFEIEIYYISFQMNVHRFRELLGVKSFIRCIYLRFEAANKITHYVSALQNSYSQWIYSSRCSLPVVS